MSSDYCFKLDMFGSNHSDPAHSRRKFTLDLMPEHTI